MFGREYEMGCIEGKHATGYVFRTEDADGLFDPRVRDNLARLCFFGRNDGLADGSSDELLYSGFLDDVCERRPEVVIRFMRMAGFADAVVTYWIELDDEEFSNLSGGPRSIYDGVSEFGFDGLAFVERADLVAKYGDDSDESVAKARECLEHEVEVYRAYLRSEIYRYEIVDEYGENLDGCSGYLGDSELAHALSEIEEKIREHDGDADSRLN